MAAVFFNGHLIKLLEMEIISFIHYFSINCRCLVNDFYQSCIPEITWSSPRNPNILYISDSRYLLAWQASWSNTPTIQLFRERLSGKVHATILKGIVGGFEFSFFQRNLKELARKAMEICLRVLTESNKFDSYGRQEQCIYHIPYYLSGLSGAHFCDNLSRNSCIQECITSILQ